MHDVNAHLTDEQLSTYLDDRLDLAENEAARSHLQTCVDCHQSLEELTYTVRALRELPMPPLPRSFQIVHEPKVSFWSRLIGSGLPLQGLAGAAAALFVVLLSADMASLTAPARIVPIAPAAQQKSAAPAQNVQATPQPYIQPAAAGRTSAEAPAPPAPAAPALATPAPTAQAAVARQADSAAEKRSVEATDSARLEALTASEGSAAAAGAVPRLSLATLTAGLVAVLLIVTAVVRSVRKA